MHFLRFSTFLIFFSAIGTLSAQSVASLQLHNLVSQHIAVGFEQSIGDYFSAKLTLGFTPIRTIPGSQIARSLILNDPDNNNFGNNGTYVKFAATPELRGYLGKKGAPGGFYLNVFGRYAYHKMTIPYSIPFNQETIDTESGLRLQIFGVGVGLGAQFLIADERIALDFYAGGGASYAPLKLEIVDESLTDAGYEALFDALSEELKVNLSPDDLPAFLTNRGLSVRAPLVLPLLRAGLGIGFVIGSR
ncbi:MAG: hypothetical protein NWR72_20770 [Bacteroidia bacterium]|nr:hypothetical protein [Bacteroidia bacterium]